MEEGGMEGEQLKDGKKRKCTQCLLRALFLFSFTFASLAQQSISSRAQISMSVTLASSAAASVTAAGSPFSPPPSSAAALTLS